MPALSWRSLKLRLPLLTVLLFLGGLWALVLFASHQLRQDMRTQVETQQQSTATFAALALEQTLQERQAVLLRVARHFGPIVEHQPEQLSASPSSFAALRQAFGEMPMGPNSAQLGLVVLQQLFNGGTFITNAEGLALTSFPPHILRIGNNYADRDFLRRALAGSSVVSPPFTEGTTPVVVMAVPIWGDSGVPVGVLAGVLDLSDPNFLSSIQGYSYGRDGGFLVVDTATRSIIAASASNRTLQALPAPGADPVLDALAQGDSTQTEYLRNGTSWLVAVRPIPIAGWKVVVNTPLAEALAPVNALSQNITLAAIVVSLLAALGMWRLLHHELRPLEITTAALAGMMRDGGTLQRVAVPKQAEVRQMALVFNHLVQEIEQRQQALRESEQLYRAAFQFSPNGLEITRLRDGRIVDVNEGFTRIYGWQRGETLERTEIALGLWLSPQDWEPLVQHIVLERSCQDVELHRRHKDGRPLTVLLSASLLLLDGEHCILWISHDVTAQRQADARIAHLTSTDTLTGLPNRQSFVQSLEQAQIQCLDGQGLGALLYLDVDDFQAVNDTLGHEAGDAFLAALARRIQAALPPNAVLSRPSGDEFLALLPALPAVLGDAALRTERVAAGLLDALETPIAFAGAAQHCTVSIGVLLFGLQHEAPMELLRKADLTLNQAKSAGPGSILFYEAQMQAQVASRARLQHSLREALQQQSFRLHYQPQVDSAGQVVGVEALVRWFSQEQGFISPAEFIPLAEKTGLILPLGRWILHTACTQLATWATQPGRGHIAMAVNVSAGQFQQDDFVQQVQEVLQETGAPAPLLKLELTESAMVEQIDAVVQRMQALRSLGVRFSIDDFGTGFSSLAYLKRLPLDQLKIDQGFVRDCLEDRNDASIAQTVIALGHGLGLEVIAEGVETLGHQAALQGWGCRFFQGYGISKPLPIEALEVFLSQPAAATTAPLPPG